MVTDEIKEVVDYTIEKTIEKTIEIFEEDALKLWKHQLEKDQQILDDIKELFDKFEKIENRLSKLESINYQNRRKS